jgi:hypothetical protein
LRRCALPFAPLLSAFFGESAFALSCPKSIQHGQRTAWAINVAELLS